VLIKCLYEMHGATVKIIICAFVGVIIIIINNKMHGMNIKI